MAICELCNKEVKEKLTLCSVFLGHGNKIFGRNICLSCKKDAEIKFIKCVFLENIEGKINPKFIYCRLKGKCLKPSICQKCNKKELV